VKRLIVVATAVACIVSMSTALSDPPVRSAAVSNRVVVIGDSVARGAGDENGLGICGWLARVTHSSIGNLGVNGARTRNIRALLLNRSVQRKVRSASLIVLSIGGNDLYGDSMARVVASVFPNFEQELTALKVRGVVASLRHLNPTARIDVLGVYNPYHHSPLSAWLDEQVNRWDARLVWTFAAWQRVNVIRIADVLQRDDRISPLDRFHPASAGYSLIASRITASM
jgi:lysophospholipase L1-like esterase